MTEAMKKDMEEAVAWVADSSRRGVDEGNSQGEEVGNGEHLLSPRLERALIADAKGDKRLAAWNLAKAQLFEAPHLPQEASFGERLNSAIAKPETEPTEAQKKAGNYKKVSHSSFGGGNDHTLVETRRA